MTMGNKIIVMLVLAMGFAGSARAELVDAVVATVDREVILQSDILMEIRPLVASDASLNDAAVQELFDETLDQAIEQKILYREGVLNNIQISDEQVEERIKGYREQYDSEQAFLNALQEAGETVSDFRERIRKQTIALSMGLSKRHYLERDVVISEAEMAQYYQDHLSEFQKPERVKLYRIFIGADKSEGAREKALARIEALREELSLGADFSQLATRHSEGPAASQGGFVGWIARGELVPDLEKVAFELSPGDVSPILETEYGMMLLKVEEKVEAGLATFDEVRNEIEPALRSRYASEKYDKWMAELRKRSRVRKFQ